MMNGKKIDALFLVCTKKSIISYSKNNVQYKLNTKIKIRHLNNNNMPLKDRSSISYT